MSTIEEEYRARSLDHDGGPFALAYALLRLAGALDGLSRSFAPPSRLGSFESDYFLIRLARRLDELAKELGSHPLTALAAELARQARSPDPPEAAEFLPKRRRPRQHIP